MTIGTFTNYMLKRFQLIPLSVLVFSDVLVIGRITQSEGNSVLIQLAVFSMVILYLFSNRVGDDKRDFEFDAKYHADRAIQKGQIDIKQLERLGYLTLVLMVCVAAYFGSLSLVLVLPVWLFSLWAKHDFSLPADFKERRFFLYNFLNMTQMLVLQLFIYSSLLNSFQFNQAIWIHVGLVFVLSLQVEVTRKVKPIKTAGKDMYSDHIGMLGGLILWYVLGLLSLLCFYFLAESLGVDTLVKSAALVACAALMFQTAWIYYQKKHEKYENLFWLGMIGSYVGQNLVLAYG